MPEAWTHALQSLSVQLVPFVMAVVFHEYAHGWMALKFGDATAKSAGRLTLNPLPHLDPIGSVVFPILSMLSPFSLLFGWAKPVPIDPRNFRRLRLGLFWVSLAGALMNFALAILSAVALVALIVFMPKDFHLYEPFTEMARVSVQLNFALALFNLLPIPPLDGSKVLQSVLPWKLAARYERLGTYGFLILMALMALGALRFLAEPVRALSQLAVGLAAYAFNAVASLFL